MKNLLSLLALTILLGCVSCNDSKTDSSASDNSGAEKKNSPMTEKNLAGTHAVMDAFQTGNTAGLDSFFASDFVDHNMMGDKKGVDSLKAMIAMSRADSKDMKMETIKELADDEYTMTWIHFTGTSAGAMSGKPGPYDMHAIEITKFKDGKAVEHWEYMDPMETMKMSGQMTPSTSEKKK